MEQVIFAGICIAVIEVAHICFTIRSQGLVPGDGERASGESRPPDRPVPDRQGNRPLEISSLPFRGGGCDFRFRSGPTSLRLLGDRGILPFPRCRKPCPEERDARPDQEDTRTDLPPKTPGSTT